uniref:Uncharacterized protein n=1 Tax=Spongospora subterranea TaxID=70186 RepID=A0A0H5QS06_9EUKA|eukprot:CRZ04442.1 hypothetical protein [Spongospora subterranea]
MEVLQVADRLFGLTQHTCSDHIGGDIGINVLSTNSMTVVCLDCVVQTMVASPLPPFSTITRLLNDVGKITSIASIRRLISSRSRFFELMNLSITQMLCRLKSESEVCFIAKLRKTVRQLINNCPSQEKKLDLILASIDHFVFYFNSSSFTSFVSSSAVESLLHVMEIAQLNDADIPENLEQQLCHIIVSCVDWHNQLSLQRTAIGIFEQMIARKSATQTRPMLGILSDSKFVGAFCKMVSEDLQRRILQIIARLLASETGISMKSEIISQYCSGLELTLFNEKSEDSSISLILLHTFIQMNPSCCLIETRALQYLTQILKTRSTDIPTITVIIDAFRILVKAPRSEHAAVSVVHALMEFMPIWASCQNNIPLLTSICVIDEILEHHPGPLKEYFSPSYERQKNAYVALLGTLDHCLEMDVTSSPKCISVLSRILSIRMISSEEQAITIPFFHNLWGNYMRHESESTETLSQCSMILRYLAEISCEEPLLAELDYVCQQLLIPVMIMPPVWNTIPYDFWKQSFSIFNLMFAKRPPHVGRKFIQDLLDGGCYDMICGDKKYITDSADNQQPFRQFIVWSTYLLDLCHMNGNSVTLWENSISHLNHYDPIVLCKRLISDVSPEELNVLIVTLVHRVHFTRSLDRTIWSEILSTLGHIINSTITFEHRLLVNIVYLLIELKDAPEDHPVAAKLLDNIHELLISNPQKTGRILVCQESVWYWIWEKCQSRKWLRSALLSVIASLSLDTPTLLRLLVEKSFSLTLSDCMEWFLTESCFLDIVSALIQRMSLTSPSLFSKITLDVAQIESSVQNLLGLLDLKILGKECFEVDAIANWLKGSDSDIVTKTRCLRAVVPYETTRQPSKLSMASLRVCFEIATTFLSKMDSQPVQSRIRCSVLLFDVIADISSKSIFGAEASTALISFMFSSVSEQQNHTSIFKLGASLIKNNLINWCDFSVVHKLHILVQVALDGMSSSPCLAAVLFLCFVRECGNVNLQIVHSEARTILQNNVFRCATTNSPVPLAIIYLSKICKDATVEAFIANQTSNCVCPIRRQAVFGMGQSKPDNLSDHFCEECGAEDDILHFTMLELLLRCDALGASPEQDQLHENGIMGKLGQSNNEGKSERRTYDLIRRWKTVLEPSRQLSETVSFY